MLPGYSPDHTATNADEWKSRHPFFFGIDNPEMYARFSQITQSRPTLSNHDYPLAP